LKKQQVLSFPEQIFNQDCLAHFWENFKMKATRAAGFCHTLPQLVQSSTPFTQLSPHFTAEEGGEK